MKPPSYGHGMDQPLPSIDKLNALEGRDLERALAAVEHVRRQAEVFLASGVARGAATAAHRADGYRTVRRSNGSWDIDRPDGSLIGEFVRAAA